eukprot:CAMPEP_0184692206 /NCGR_PEP_ID=MMETSP0313-20130426/782_1 /TAXON_ID=2792 /ORGANISM="Porphyridium aerugineum, Strain SAG 1380-2" /LENGTH=248 /DNA_ID=CAMNT_0027150019 /DNA_START=85 /DNA_END=831 /DNA_ORIENTATION=+
MDTQTPPAAVVKPPPAAAASSSSSSVAAAVPAQKTSSSNEDWKQYAHVTNKRAVFAFCCKEARKLASTAIATTSDSTSSSEPQRVRNILATLPDEIVKMIGTHIHIPKVFVTQLTWNRGAEGKYGPVVSICGPDIYVNNLKINGAHFTGAVRHELISWTTENNLHLVQARDPIRPSAAQIYFDSEYDSFSGLAWCTEGEAPQPQVRLIFGRKAHADGQDPFEGQYMWKVDTQATQNPPANPGNAVLAQ